ncbi:hypothetical protein Droror1_Dr00000256 [Drosera rotundifolia]
MSKGKRVLNPYEAMTNEQLRAALAAGVFKASKAKGARWGMRLVIATFDEDGNVLASREFREREQLDNINRVTEEAWILLEEYFKKMRGELGETVKDMFDSAIRRTPRDEGGDDDDNNQTPGGDGLDG